MNVLKVNELFSGIGSQRKALERQNINHEVIGIAEIDKYAIKSYEGIFGETRNYGDISKIDKLDYADFWSYSFPCTDISVSGKMAGINKDTRSGLLYQVERLLNVAKDNNELPKYLMLENVKNLVGKKFKLQFDEWLNYLDLLGYNNYWKVLNAKDYGIPQNRERVFVISIRKDIDNYKFEFPKPFDSGTRLKDLLEQGTEEGYYISQDRVNLLLPQIKNMNALLYDTSQCKREIFLREYNNYSPTLNSRDYKDPRLVNVNTLEDCVLNNFRIRKLTPKEVWRLMGFDDKDFNKAKYENEEVSKEILLKHPNHKGRKNMEYGERIERMSNSQLYKQAGNSIVVDVLEEIFKKLFVDYIGSNNLQECKDVSRNFSVATNRLFLVGGINNKKKEGSNIMSFKQGYRIYHVDGLSCTITATGGGLGGKSGLYLIEGCEK